MDKTELEKKLETESQGDEKATAGADAETGGEQPPASDVSEAAKERDEMADRLLRLRAEFDNYRKRVHRDTERMRHTAAETLLRDLLPVVDHLELAMTHKDDQSGALAEGVSHVVRQFHDVLRRHGLEPIAAAGEPFNPEIHEAVMQQASDEHPPDTVIQEFQRGYKLGPVVLRPTKVVVAQRPAEEPTVEEDETESAPETAEPDEA